MVALLAPSVLVVLSLSPVRGPGPRATRLAAIAETWGRRVRVAALVAEAHEDALLSAAALNASKTVEVWQVPARDHALRFSQYKAMVYGLQRALRDARNEWIFWANDHTFLIVENLECFLRRFDSRQPHSLGMRMWGPCCGLFNSGAAGFALSRKAVGMLDARWRVAEANRAAVAANGQPGVLDERCDPEHKRAHVARCLDSLGTRPVETRDASTAERFHVYGVVRLGQGHVDEWLLAKKRNMKPPEDLLRGPASVAPDSVSFHYVAGAETRALDAALHGSSSERTAAALAEKWPKSPDLGGYSGGFPAKPPAQAKVAETVARISLCATRLAPS